MIETDQIKKFRKELTELINKHSIENWANIPDFILAEYLTECLADFCYYTDKIKRWYGVHLEPGNSHFIEE